MKSIAFILASTVVLGSCQSPTSQTQSKADSTAGHSNAGEWTPLFPDNSTSGWHAYGKTAPGKAWQIKDGILHLDASRKADWQTKDGGDLISNQEYENFDLKVDWKISRAGNSGIMFYVHEDTTKFKYPWQSGPETQIADNKENEDGRRPKRHAGDLYDMLSLSKDVVKPAGEWNQTEVIADKGKLEIIVNQQKVLTATLWDAHWKQLVAGSKFKEWPGFGTYKKGHIALQDHGADVWFRNVMIKKLN